MSSVAARVSARADWIVSRRRRGAQRALEQPPGRRQPPVRARRAILPWWVWLGMIVAAVLLSLSYSLAAGTSRGHGFYAVFWLAEIACFFPIGIRLAMPRVARSERLTLLIALGLMMHLPKFLRNPAAPLYNDEYAHWLASQQIVAHGTLFAPDSLLPIVAQFPGMQAVVAELHDLSGIPTFVTGNLLIFAIQMAVLVGVFLIAERGGLSAHVAGLAALLYAVNPSLMYFDGEFSYESLAMLFVIWALVAVTSLLRLPEGSRRHRAWAGNAMIAVGALTVTHHLSNYYLAALLVGIAIAGTWRLEWGGRRRLLAWMIALWSGGLAALWYLLVAPQTGGYLSPYLGASLSQLWQTITGGQGPRTLFAQSTVPGYERVFAFIGPPLALVLTLLALRHIWRELRRRRGSQLPAELLLSPSRAALVLLGIVYFVSLPFVLSAAGNEAARRSWTFSYIGLAVTIAPLLGAWARREPSTAARPERLVGARRMAVWLVAPLVALVLLGGNVTTAINETYRFPGPYQYGSDARSGNAETLAAQRWFTTTAGTGRRLIADRYISLPFDAYGAARSGVPSAGFPFYEMYFSSAPVHLSLLRQLQSSGYDWLVIDGRMATQLPRIGIYFASGEPLAGGHTTPLPAAALQRFNQVPWAEKVYNSDNYSSYRFVWPALDGPVAGTP